MNYLALLTPRNLMVAGAALALAAALWFSYGLGSDHKEQELGVVIAQLKLDAETIRAERALVAANAASAALAKGIQRQTDTDEVAHDGQAKLDRIPALARDTRASGAGLRLDAAAAVAAAGCRGPAPDPAASAPGQGHPDGSAAAGVLADVLGRLEEAGGRVAEVATERGIRIAACVGAHEALRPGGGS